MITKKQFKKLKKRVQALEREIFEEYEAVFEPEPDILREKPVLQIVTDEFAVKLSEEHIARIAAESGGGDSCEHKNLEYGRGYVQCLDCELLL
jgi:hypothetical protein